MNKLPELHEDMKKYVTDEETIGYITDVISKKFESKEEFEEFIKEYIDMIGVEFGLKFPFFFSMMTKLKVRTEYTIPTLATDGRNIFVNPYYLMVLSTDEVFFVLAHEIMHCIVKALLRQEGRETKLWNLAADLWTNAALVESGVGKINPSWILSGKINSNMSTEEIYEILKNPPPEFKKDIVISEIAQMGSSSKIQFDIHLQPASDNQQDDSGDQNSSQRGQGNQNDDNGQEGQSGRGNKDQNGIYRDKQGRPMRLPDKEYEQAVNEMMRHAKITMDNLKAAGATALGTKNEGTVPAGLERIIEELFRPKISWKSHLAATGSGFRKKLPDRRKINWRRTGCNNTCLVYPGKKPGPMVTVFCWLDMSGSISQREAKEMLSEVRFMMSGVDEFELYVGSFDTQVYNVQKFTQTNIRELENYRPTGCGGTDFLSMFRYMKENEIHPMQMIVFTDGYPCGAWVDEEWCREHYKTKITWIIHGDLRIHEVPGRPKDLVLYYDDCSN